MYQSTESQPSDVRQESPQPDPSQFVCGPGASNPERWVEDHGDYLFRFALTRLRDPIRAEDAVQETFLAALKSRDRFAGRSTERTWLVGILRNKIFDHFRRARREIPFTDFEFYSTEGSCSFGDGHDNERRIQDAAPQESPNWAHTIDNTLFWQTYQDCSSKLPKKMAAAFNLRAVEGVESKKICALLNISEANLWVLYYRARMALRRSLETTWFAKEFQCLPSKL